MKILELANQLKAIYDTHGDIEVMFTNPNDNNDTFSIGGTTVRVAQQGEFPKEWDMPAGFKFVELSN
jgi:hypothetical protein